MEKKNLYFILLGSLLLVVIILLFLLFKKDNQRIEEITNLYEPEFLSEEQKIDFGLSAETKAQVFHDETGQLIYRIIKEEADIVLDPENYGLKY